MSSAPTIPQPAPAPPKLKQLPSLHDFFSPTGILSKSSLAFEYRKGQHDMARAVESALNDKRHLIVEAGTGTGKTLAYLVPALRYARAHGQRVILSTGTKNLQEQLYFKDVPFLESVLGEQYGPLRVCYMKGRANYLCKNKLFALRDSPLLSGLDEIEQFHHIVTWERTTPTGDRAELDHLPEGSQLWQKLDARTEACLGTTCPDWEQCYVTQMRRKALESDLIIVNHHLFFADLNIKREAAGATDAGILPDAAAVIFDEAHELEDIASNYFGIGLSHARFDELTRDVETTLRAKKAGTSALESATAILKDRARMFFAALPTQGPLLHLGNARMPFDRTERETFLESDGDIYLGVINALKRVESELSTIRNIDETKGFIKRTNDIRDHLRFLLESDDPNVVHWIERRATSGVRTLARGPAQQIFQTHLQATPIDVSTLLTTQLFDAYPTVVLTSATLTVSNAFNHITSRLGLTSTRELIVPSHFNYEQQALLYLPPSMPDPREPDFILHAAERMRRVLEITRGRAFCLFTSYSAMRAMHDRLLQELPYPLLLHGTAPRHVLLQRFRDTPNAILFGTSSFWQGVDVQGEQLSCVIIDRLPFAVPTDPVVKARMQAIEIAGGKPFFDLQVPAAVITLKQGFGRLIRSLEDRGVLMLLDPRIQRQRYGKVFLDSLPPYTLTQSIEDVKAFFA